MDIHNQIVHNIETEDSGTNIEETNVLSFQCNVPKCNHYFQHLVDYNRHFSLAHSRTVIQRQEKQLKTNKAIIEGQKQLLRNKQVIVCLLEKQVENSERYIEHLERQLEEKILGKICYQRKRLLTSVQNVCTLSGPKHRALCAVATAYSAQCTVRSRPDYLIVRVLQATALVCVQVYTMQNDKIECALSEIAQTTIRA